MSAGVLSNEARREAAAVERARVWLIKGIAEGERKLFMQGVRQGWDAKDAESAAEMIRYKQLRDEEVARLKDQLLAERHKTRILVTDQDLIAENKQFRRSLADVMKLIEDGTLVRDISKDHEPTFHLRMLDFIAKLKHADVILKAGGGE